MLKLNLLLADNVILQADKSCKISGTTEPFREIFIQLGAFSTLVKSDSEGQFYCELPPQDYNITEKLTIRSGDDQQTITVQYGDVFLFAGQSNMDYRMENETHFQEELAGLMDQSVFFTNVPKIEYEDENKRIPEIEEWKTWQKLTKDTLKDMSAIAYYAVKEHRRKYPERIVGVVTCSMGGTSASCWISEDYLAMSPAIKADILRPYKEAIRGREDQMLLMELLSFWKESEKYYGFIQEHPEMTRRQLKEQVGYSPWPPPANPHLFTRPGGLYQVMFKRIVPFTFSSVIWYQGEEDTEHSYLYEELLRMLIKQWRGDLKEQVPFYIVQLPICKDRPGHDWTLVRHAQERVSQEIEDCYLVTGLDCGDRDDIHPTEKAVLGKRIGEIIDEIHYKQCPVASIRSWSENKVIIEINQAKEVQMLDVRSIQSDQKIEDHIIEGNCLILHSKARLNQIQYAWSNAPEVTLFNEAGYPVSPFSFVKNSAIYKKGAR